MHGVVIDNGQSQGALHDFNPVHLSEANSPTEPGGIVDHDFISRRLTANRHLERSPAFGNAGVEMQESAADAQPQNALDAGALHPTGRARVPRPAATSDMGR